MKYLKFIVIAVVAVSLAYFFFAANRDAKDEKTQNFLESQQTTQNSFETKADEQGQVTVKVTPQILNGDQWKFDVVLDTHSVDLSYDMVQIAELINGQGNTYKPIAWEGAPPGGHHREGVLVFQSVSPTSASIELKIKDVGGVPERSFKWNLK